MIDAKLDAVPFAERRLPFRFRSPVRLAADYDMAHERVTAAWIGINVIGRVDKNGISEGHGTTESALLALQSLLADPGELHRTCPARGLHQGRGEVDRRSDSYANRHHVRRPDLQARVPRGSPVHLPVRR